MHTKLIEAVQDLPRNPIHRGRILGEFESANLG